jgi:prefoldin subunit 5
MKYTTTKPQMPMKLEDITARIQDLEQELRELKRERELIQLRRAKEEGRIEVIKKTISSGNGFRATRASWKKQLGL